MSQPGKRAAVPAGATEWAAAIDPGTPVRWKQLEMAAWHRHRTVLSAMEPGKHMSRRLTLALAAAVFALAAPIFGFAFISPGFRFIAPTAQMDPELSVRGAGLSFLVADLLLAPVAVHQIRKWRSGRRGGRGPGWVPLILGAWSLALGAMKQGEVDHLWWWLSPIIVATLAGLVIVLLGGSPPPEDKATRVAHQDGVAERRRHRILAAAAEVPPDDRERVAADLRGAVDDLARRGVIDPGEAERALEAPLGGLSHHMAQRGPRPTTR